MSKSSDPGRPARLEGSRADKDHCASFVALAYAALGFLGEQLHQALCYVPVVGCETVIMPVKPVGPRQPIKFFDPAEKIVGRDLKRVSEATQVADQAVRDWPPSRARPGRYR